MSFIELKSISIIPEGYRNMPYKVISIHPGFSVDARNLFGKNIKRLLDGSDKFSAQDLANFIGLPEKNRSLIYRWRMGKTLPSRYIDKIAEYFNIPVSELFAENPIESNKKDVSLDDAIRVVTRELGYKVEKVGKPK